MSNFILISGIVCFFLFLTAVLLVSVFKKKIKWHKYFAYTALAVMFLHATVATYKVIRLYFDFS